MSYRHIPGTTIEVPDWVHVPAFSEFSQKKRDRNRFLISELRKKYFGSKKEKAEKTKP
ncbi:hypothetical protein [Shewanella sp. WE21]|uniref:hypothetical protein n=1 Tax=Shewanella sp. WE21 TaxID=2029986 RepID=UPI001319F005|nr:hypothetical protein [Shewanella sp. WE21]